MDQERQTAEPIVQDDMAAAKLFMTIQFLFLILSGFTGGFNYKLWSMLDSALLIQAIGITALVVVLADTWLRRLVFKVAIFLYLVGIFDMGINVLISGVVGFGKFVD
jgi:hypothetical protein